MEQKEVTNQELLEASLLVLGYLIGKFGFKDPAAVVMAKALKNMGIESVYIEATIAEASK